MKTVSRVLNREPNVADKTRERVLEAARELRYTPNLAARGLATSKSYLLALLYDNATPSYILKVQQGATLSCQDAGYHLIVHPMRGSMQMDEDDAAQALERLPVDGVILTSPLSDNPAILAALTKLNIRFTCLGASLGQTAHKIIGIDNHSAAKDMTEFLIKSGHKDIGFVKGHPNHLSSRLRFNGFKAAMAAARLTLNHEWIAQGDYSFTSGEVAARGIFSRTQRPTAIFASNDDMAAGVVSVASRQGLSVPDQLSVTGFDDTPLARILWPQLTTIKQPIYEMGYRAAELLITPPGSDEESKSYCMIHDLIIRDSTKPHN